MTVYLSWREAARRIREPLMVESRPTRVLLRLGAGATLAFIYFPLVVIAIYAFNENISQTWPIEQYTTKWFRVAWEDEDVRDALWLSVKAALGATAIALVLGTLASLAVARYSFFGKETISFVVILPIALPGIITGLALQATILNVLAAARHQLRDLDDHHRARDFLHRRRLQQRGREDATRIGVARGGIDGSRRRLAGRRSAT